MLVLGSCIIRLYVFLLLRKGLTLGERLCHRLYHALFLALVIPAVAFFCEMRLVTVLWVKKHWDGVT